MTEHSCVTCPVLRPSSEPRVYERANVCEGCRAGMSSILQRLPDETALLCADPTLNAGEWHDGRGRTHRDPVAKRLPAGPTAGSKDGPRISGTAAPSPGFSLDQLNLVSPLYLGQDAASHVSESSRYVDLAYRTIGPALKSRDELCGDVEVIDGVQRICLWPFGHVRRHSDGERSWDYRRPTFRLDHDPAPGKGEWRSEPLLDAYGRQRLTQRGGTDQVGSPPPLFILDQWVQDWITYDLGDFPPPPTMTELTRWLLDRLDEACDRHPAIDDFARELSELAATVGNASRAGDRGRGEKVGRCPVLLRDDSRCGTQLRVDPYADVIACHRCGSTWHRRTGEWLKLRAEQLKVA